MGIKVNLMDLTKSGELSQKCDVCKKGYLTKLVWTVQGPIYGGNAEFVDCSNPECGVHLEFDRKVFEAGKAFQKRPWWKFW